MGAVSFRWKLNSSPDVAELIREQCVAAAVDIDTFELRDDKEGEFFRKFRVSSQQQQNDKFRDQAIYIVDTAGNAHARLHERDFATEKIDGLKSILSDFKPVEISRDQIVGQTDETYSGQPPEGARIAKIVITHGRPQRERNEIHWQQDFQRDNLWILEEEAQALAASEVPHSLMLRIVRFHMVRYYHGRPTSWTAGEVKQVDASLKDGVLRATYHLERPIEEQDKFSGETIRMKGSLLGYVTAEGDRLTRFDVISKSQRLDLYIGKPQPEATQVQRFALVDNVQADESAKLMPGVFQCNGTVTLKEKYLDPTKGE